MWQLSERVLPNGLCCIAIENQPHPQTEVRIIIPAGPANDGASSGARSALLIKMMLIRLHRKIDRKQVPDGFVSMGHDLDNIWITSSGGVGQLSARFEELRAFLTSFDFTERDFAIAQAQVSQELRSMIRSTAPVARQLLHRQLFPNHPYARTLCRQSDIEATTLADVEEFFSHYIRPRGTAVIVAAPVKGRVTLEALSNAFSAWSDDPQPRGVPKVVSSARGCVMFVHDPRAEDAAVKVATPIPSRGDSQHASVLAGVAALGGFPGSRLHRTLRAQGSAYTVGAVIHSFRRSALLLAGAETEPAIAVSAANTIENELVELARGRPPRRETGEAKQHLISNTVKTFENPVAFANLVAAIAAGGHSAERTCEFAQQICWVRPRDIQEAARRFLNPDNMVTLIVGDVNAMSVETVQSQRPVRVLELEAVTRLLRVS